MDIIRYTPEHWTQLRDEWNRLADENPDASVFQRFEWNEAWWRAFGETQDLYVLAAFEDGRLAGLAPLLRRNVRTGGRRLRQIAFLADQVTDYCRILTAPGRETEVYRALWHYFQSRPKDWDVIRLNELPENAWPGLMRSLEAFPFPRARNEAAKTFHIPVADRNWDQYWNRINKRLRAKHERQSRLLAGYRHRVFTGDGITPRLLAEIDELNRWIPADKRDGSIFLNEAYRRFHCDYLFRSPLKSHIVITALYLGAKLAAYHYSFDYKNVINVYHCNYDEVFDRLSVGFFLDMLNIRAAFESGRREMDFLRGDYDYKRNYNTQVRQNCELLVFRNASMQKRYELSRRVYAAAKRFYVEFGLPLKRWARDGWRAGARFFRQLRKNGWRHYARIVAGMLGGKIWINGRAYVLRADRKLLAGARCAKPVPDGCEFREITLADYTGLEKLVSRKNMPIIVERFWAKDRCWGAFERGTLVGYCWLTDKDTHDVSMGFEIKVASGELYLYDCMIHPAHRGRGLMYLLLYSLFQSEFIRGFRIVTSIVFKGNWPIIKTLHGLQFACEEEIRRLRLLFFNWESRSRIAADK